MSSGSPAGAPPAPIPPAEPAPAVRARDRGLGGWALAILVSLGILGYLFAAQGLDIRDLGAMVTRMSLAGLGAFVAVSLAALLLRAARYWVLLEGQAAFSSLVLVTLVRNLFVDLVPVRAGAAASYLYLVTIRLGLPVEAAMASFALAFVLDTLALAPLLLGAVLVTGSAPISPTLLAVACLGLLAASVVALVLLAPVLRLAAAVAGRLPGRLARLGEPLAGAADGVRRLEGRGVLVPALVLSLALRLAKYAAYYCLLAALLAGQTPPAGQSSWDLGFLQVFLSVAGAELAASLPLPTVASLGPYEAAGAVGFAYWLGLPRHLATLAATAFHGLSQVHDYGLGLIALLWITSPWAPGRRGRATRPSG